MANETQSEMDLLRSINERLGAILAITLDSYIRTHGISGAKPKPIDQMLFAAGLSTNEIAVMLNKSQRAVQIAVATNKPAKKPSKRAAKF